MDTSHNCVNCLRLTSALGAAHGIIKKLVRLARIRKKWMNPTIAEQDLKKDMEVEEAEAFMADPSGSVAFEKWKALQNTKQEYDKAMNVCLDKFSNQKFGSVADCLNGIFEKWKKMEAVVVAAKWAKEHLEINLWKSLGASPDEDIDDEDRPQGLIKLREALETLDAKGDGNER